MKTVVYQSPEYFEMLALRHKILREPLGLNFSDDDLQREKDDVFVACSESDRIIGCCILTRVSDHVVKLRQMAVDSHQQGKNIGKNLLLFAEQYAAQQGYSTIEMHARKTAATFYAKYGYTAIGNDFIEVGIPHIFMVKHLKKK